jgi:hypothetical protein
MATRALWWAAIGLVLAITIIAVVVWAAWPRPTGPDCGISSSGQTPLEGFFAWSNPQEQSVGSDHWYNSSVQSVTGGLLLENLAAQLETPSGLNATLGLGSALTVRNSSGPLAGTYPLAGPGADTWIVGATNPVSNGQAFDLLSTPASLSGDLWTFYLNGSSPDGCPIEGSVTISIP